MSDINCNFLKFLYPRTNEFLYCRDVCSPSRTAARNVLKFCVDNCPDYIRLNCSRLSTRDSVTSTLLDGLTTLSSNHSQAVDFRILMIIVAGGVIILLIVAGLFCFKYKPWKFVCSDISLPRPADPEVQKQKQDRTDVAENENAYSRLRDDEVEATAIKPQPVETKTRSASLLFQETEYNALYGGSAAQGAALYKLLMSENDQGQHNVDLSSTDNTTQQTVSSEA